MGNLNELVERTTIEFPFPLPSEEIENKLFPYLKNNLSADIIWSFRGFGYVSLPDSEVIRGLDRINLTVSERKSPFSFATFELNRQDGRENYFNSVKLSTPGCDGLEELRAMPSGERELALTDKLRLIINEYFLQH